MSQHPTHQQNSQPLGEHEPVARATLPNPIQTKFISASGICIFHLFESKTLFPTRAHDFRSVGKEHLDILGALGGARRMDEIHATKTSRVSITTTWLF